MPKCNWICLDVYKRQRLFFDQRNRTLDEIRQVLALEHAVGQQRKVDDLLDEPVFAEMCIRDRSPPRPPA